MRVLLVDDHPVAREAVRELLEDRGHIVVAEAADGREAVAAAARCNPDAVVLDLGLGGESGIDVSRALTEKWPDLPVLLVSVSADGSPELVKGCGARGLMRKERLFTVDLAALCNAEGRPRSEPG